ncbi:hypothetical protein [Sediminicola sp. 1XM1-17]
MQLLLQKTIPKRILIFECRGAGDGRALKNGALDHFSPFDSAQDRLRSEL